MRRVGADEDLRPGEVTAVELDADARGRRRQAIVARAADGRLRAYLNLCRHLPVPLDAFTGDLLDDAREHLVCVTHGALYRISDGYCFEGPCEGDRLEPLPLEIVDGVVYLKA